MYYSEIKSPDIANGPGIRTVLFVSGCDIQCKGCFNSLTWDYHYGQPFTEETMRHLLDLMEPDYMDGFTMLGGEPMNCRNSGPVADILQRIRAQYPTKNLWSYSGYTYNWLRRRELKGDEYGRNLTRIFDSLDCMVDGPVVIKKKDLSLLFRGSSNQRVLDMKATRATGEIVLHPLSFMRHGDMLR